VREAEAALPPYALQAGREQLYRLRRRAHDDPLRSPSGSKEREGGDYRLAVNTVPDTIIILDFLRLCAGTCSQLCTAVAVEDTEPRAKSAPSRGSDPSDRLRWTHYPRSPDHLLAARRCQCSCSAQRSMTASLALDQSRSRTAAYSRRKCRPMRTLRSSTWAVSPTPRPRAAPA
jgi:hypothetical protein